MVSLDSASFFLYGGMNEFTQDDRGDLLADSWIYNVGSGWTDVPRVNAFPSGRAGPSCTFLRGKVWMFGGGNDRALENDIWSFDPKTNTWKKEYDSKTSPDDGQPTTRYVAKMIGVGVYLVINGGDLDGDSAASDAGLYFFNTQTGKWATSAAQLQNITTEPKDSPGLSGGLLWGVIGGVVAAVVLFATGIFLFFLRRRRNRERAEGKQKAVDFGLSGLSRVVPLPLNDKMDLRNADFGMENKVRAAVPSDDKSAHTGMPHVGQVFFRPGGRQEPVSGNEIMISPDDVVYVKEMYADGWAQGWNSTTNASGSFPYSCVRSV
ncbi:hypothetical protein DFS34DRAFT_384866 [Phlyctochytrium arcticum]|nr:hypothetical protein DFS34DRAFT_384866 [Phlyctochytrium arcticum]